MASGNMLRGLSRNRYDAGRASPAARTAAAGFVGVVSVTAASKLVTVQFDQAVVVGRTPAWTAGGQVPSASRLTGPTTLELTYPNAFTADTTLVIPASPATVRGVTGGCVRRRRAC